MIGTRLEHYEITAHLGSGGMGEVYRATDSKLGRSVAIKILPDAFARDEERLARFEREARVLASLNHPHIAAIYGIEESADRKFLVMELATGETLADRIARGPIPLDQALAIAPQIAEALEAAHEKGIIHRDLKPANIKVSADGRVKVLDFGLAKAFAGEVANSNLSNSPTMSLAATNAGVILGTPAYMSPEQAKGAEVDRRTDVFSLGAVLYEVLTGRQAFPGDNAAEVLAAVIKEEPAWDRLPKETPPAIRRLLQRSLRKDRNRRLQTAADFLIEIEESVANPVQPVHISALPHRERLAWIAALVLAVTVAVAASRLLVQAPVADAAETRVDIVTPPGSNLASFAISPDSRKIAFVAEDGGQQKLWVRSLDKTAAESLAGTEGALLPFWSPDSKAIGFFAVGALKRIDLGGGAPQTLASLGNANPGGGTWSPDGVILFSRGAQQWRVSASGGDAAQVTRPNSPQTTNQRFPQFLPDGRRFLFTVEGTPEARAVYLGSIDSTETRRLVSADAFTASHYVRPGWLFFVRQGALLAQRFHLERGEISGDAITVANQVTSTSAGVMSGTFSVSAQGVIAYRSFEASSRQLVWFDRSGKELGSVGAADALMVGPNLSPDGRRAAVGLQVQSNTDVWILDEARARRLTFDAGVDQFPVWSPDGTQVAFDSLRKGTRDLYVKPSDGAGSDELIVESPIGKSPVHWSSDGRFLLYWVADPKTLGDLWVLPMLGERKPFVFLNTPGDERAGQFSPNGRWVAYHSSESGRLEIYVRPFPGPGGQWLISSGGGVQPRWSRDGRELYYIAPGGTLMVVPVVERGGAIEPGPPAPLFQTRVWDGGSNFAVKQQYDVSTDGRFLINVTTAENNAPPITLILNWQPQTQ
jgi:serine/threonine protein kinase/Tol biopolymer transport system component